MKRLILSLILAVLLSAIVVSPAVASEAVLGAVINTTKGIIPSIFPLMVVSDLIISLLYHTDKSSNRLNKYIFVFVLSNLCGFPIGAKLTSRMKSEGDISEKGAVISAVLCNNVSPSFLIFYVGEKLFSCRNIGVFLYATQLLCSVIVSVLYLLLTKRQIYRTNQNHTVYDSNRYDLLESFKNSVTGSAISCINIAAFISFFSIIINYSAGIINKAGLPSVFVCITAAILEMSRGCAEAVQLQYSDALAVCAFSAGFSGMSVILQSIIFLRKENINVRHFFILKLMQGVLTSVFCYCFLPTNIELQSASTESGTVNVLHGGTPSLVTLTIIIAYLCTVAIQFCLNLYKSREKS